MEECEKIHALTDAIYRNLMENFSPGIRQLISTGRTYQKALQHVTTAAKCYIECLYSLAQSGQVCKGATSEIGAALLQLAEVHKEINSQVIENIKSVHAELLIPMENKQESEFRHIPVIHKKYINGHKFHAVPYVKAQTMLKKHKKRSKAKFGFDQKEMMYAREVRERRMKMDDYHIQGLRQALMEERKSYCFLLDRMCCTVQYQASHHRKSHELLTHRLFDWTNFCRFPTKLPPSSEAVIQAFHNQDSLYETTEESPETRRRRRQQELERWAYAARNSGGGGGGGGGGSGGGGDSGDSLPYSLAVMERADNAGLTYGYVANGGDGRQAQYAVTGIHMRHSADPRQRPLLVETRPRGRALYTHTGLEETQLSFLQGDVLLLIGRLRDGWQYGENTRTHRLGWFPASFMQLLDDTDMEMKKSFTLERVKSLSNLADPSGVADYVAGGSVGPPRSCDLESGQASLQRGRPVSMYLSQPPPHPQVPAYGSSKIFFPTPIPEVEEKWAAPRFPPPTTVANQIVAMTTTAAMRDYARSPPPSPDVQASSELLPPVQFQDGSVCSSPLRLPAPRLT